MQGKIIHSKPSLNALIMDLTYSINLHLAWSLPHIRFPLPIYFLGKG